MHSHCFEIKTFILKEKGKKMQYFVYKFFIFIFDKLVQNQPDRCSSHGLRDQLRLMGSKSSKENKKGVKT